MIKSFSFAAIPPLHVGGDKISALSSCIRKYGTTIVLVTGARSFTASKCGQEVLQRLRDDGIRWQHFAVHGEPTPSMIDEASKRFASTVPACVVAIGGGSALDAGKAISAMLPLNAPVKDYLEGVGNKLHPGVKVPFIAVPTTSGTGSEATKNAVISEIGEHGYKRSLRHDNFVPDMAIVDPLLTVDCPPAITASSGMDAFTQLLESYVSTSANPLSDALALEGLKRIARSLLTAYVDGHNPDARADMSLASYLSGITLANAGLGLVHGFASPVGGYFDIPHGVICSALMASCNHATVRKLRATNTNPQALKKYATAGRLFSTDATRSDEYYTDLLLERIEFLTKEMKIPPLSNFRVKPEHFRKIVASTDNKNNPVKLDESEMLEVLERAG
jgi:alcohol dehydrogenase class IV